MTGAEVNGAEVNGAEVHGSAPTRHPRAAGGNDRGRHREPRRVSDMVKASVRSGLYTEDTQLTEDVLISSLGASRTAVRAALQALAAEGVVLRSPGHGTHVRHRPVRLALRDSAVTDGATAVSLTIVDQRTVPTTALLRERLRTADDTVRMVENTYSDGTETIGVRTAYFSRDVTFTEYSGPADMATVAVELFGRALGRIESEVGSAVADEHTARLIGLPVGAPVLVREQLVVAADGTPLEVVFDHFRADRVTFVDRPGPPRA